MPPSGLSLHHLSLCFGGDGTLSRSLYMLWMEPPLAKIIHRDNQTWPLVQDNCLTVRTSHMDHLSFCTPPNDPKPRAPPNTCDLCSFGCLLFAFCSRCSWSCTSCLWLFRLCSKIIRFLAPWTCALLKVTCPWERKKEYLLFLYQIQPEKKDAIAPRGLK